MSAIMYLALGVDTALFNKHLAVVMVDVGVVRVMK